jgi:hypothetical protein
MPKKIIVTVGSDAKRTGKFYWNVKDASSQDIFIERIGFDTKEDARADLDGFRKEFANTAPLENFF